jgi:hypothetical protein
VEYVLRKQPTSKYTTFSVESLDKQKMNVTIRPAQAEDANRLLPLVQQFAISFVVDAVIWADSFHEILQTPHPHLIVAQREYELLGYLLWV